MNSAFYKDNKINSLNIVDNPSTSVSNRQRLGDSMKSLKYYGLQADEVTITFTINSNIDTISIINCNLKSFTIKGDDSDFSTPINVSNSTNQHFHFEFDLTNITEVVIDVTETHLGGSPFIGYLLITEKIGEIISYDGSIGVNSRSESITQKTSTGQLWTTILNNTFEFSVNTKVKEDENIFLDIYNNYFLSGNVVVYIHHYGVEFNKYRGILERVIFDQNFQLGYNFLGNRSSYIGYQEIKGKMLPAGGGI